MTRRYIRPYIAPAFSSNAWRSIPRMRVLPSLGLCLCLLLVSAPSPRAQAAEIRVYAAASLKEALDAQARRFETRSPHRIVAVYAASSALARQIEAGAPADLFISADEPWMDEVERRGRLQPGSRVALLSNTLVLIAPAASPLTLRIAPGFPLATALGGAPLAMADPDAVPAGRYGKAALEKLGVWTSVAPRVVRGENVRTALNFVARGEAALGIVYGSDARAEPRVRVVDVFPADAYPPIVYPAALVAGSAAAGPARAFLDFLRSPAAAALWRAQGFRPLAPQAAR